MNKKLIKSFKYANDNISETLLQRGIFIAVKMICLFVQTYAADERLTYSNNDLMGKLGCSLSSLHDAFKVVERAGIIRRTYKDDKKRIRDEFFFDIDMAMSWMKTTKFDDAYKNATKRSLFKAFVNQTVIFIIDMKERILEAVGVRRTKDRKEKISEIIKRTEKYYKRYQKHLNKRIDKQAAINAKRAESIEKKDLIKGLIEWSLTSGYEPPGTLKTA